MDAAARAKLAERIASDPEQYVAQEQVALSTAPVRTDAGPTPRHVVLRMFATWSGQGYVVMPGGLTRVSTEAAVKFDYLVYVYRYEFHGREIWRANRLAWVDNRAVDAGKALRVRATIEGNGSTIEANGRIRGPPGFSARNSDS